ncbi:MAG: SGNH hydrolase domain-containing protein [Chloroflexota bacterium]
MPATVTPIDHPRPLRPSSLPRATAHRMTPAGRLDGPAVGAIRPARLVLIGALAGALTVAVAILAMRGGSAVADPVGTPATRSVVGDAALPSLTTAPSPAATPAGPSSSAPATLTPSPPALLPPRPPTRDGPVPASLRPSLTTVAHDLPAAYLDRCHTQQDAAPSTAPCFYGDLKSRTTIALFGDSHALSWFPAVERLAVDRGWRLLSLTMSACSPADIRAYQPRTGRVSAACSRWREWALDRLAQIHPAIVLVGGTRGFAVADAAGQVLTGDARTRAWEAGMARTLTSLRTAAGMVIYIADTPIARVDPPTCLATHRSSILACSTPVARAINETWLAVERRITAQAGIDLIDPQMWICPSSPCPLVIGNLLVYRDGGHLTATFAGSLWRRLEGAVIADVARRLPRLVR